MDKIKNNNLKKLAKKISRFKVFYNAPKELQKLFLSELKFAKLIIPAFDVDDEWFSIKFHEYQKDRYSFRVFTDLDEYNKVYGNDSSVEPLIFEIIYFTRNVYNDLIYLSINNSCNVRMDIIRDIISLEMHYWGDVEEFSHHYTLKDTQKLIESYDNQKLNNYLDERKYIQSYYSFLNILIDCVLFCGVLIEDDMGDKVNYRKDVKASLYTEDNYVILYTDLNLIKTEHYSVVDFLNLIHSTLYDRYKGIKIDTGFKMVTFSRKSLLKNYDIILNDFFEYNMTDTLNYIFKFK